MRITNEPVKCQIATTSDCPAVGSWPFRKNCKKYDIGEHDDLDEGAKCGIVGYYGCFIKTKAGKIILLKYILYYFYPFMRTIP